MKCFVVSMFVVAVLAVSVPVNANTVFSENFESHATGTAIQNATGWETSAADGPVLIANLITLIPAAVVLQRKIAAKHPSS